MKVMKIVMSVGKEKIKINIFVEIGRGRRWTCTSQAFSSYYVVVCYQLTINGYCNRNK